MLTLKRIWCASCPVDSHHTCCVVYRRTKTAIENFGIYQRSQMAAQCDTSWDFSASTTVGKLTIEEMLYTLCIQGPISNVKCWCWSACNLFLVPPYISSCLSQNEAPVTSWKRVVIQASDRAVQQQEKLAKTATNANKLHLKLTMLNSLLNLRRCLCNFSKLNLAFLLLQNRFARCCNYGLHVFIPEWKAWWNISFILAKMAPGAIMLPEVINVRAKLELYGLRAMVIDCA